ncbi:MAG TPA: NnrS family protein, partial [Marinobacter sp.]|nr:NnrS family protein [Marinobacter sp.]
MTNKARKPVHAFWLFFPAASILAALAVPLSVYTVASGTGWPSGLLGAGHGHELIFGFALALIAGYTLGPQPRSILLPLFSLWLLARIAWLI